jgi:hypothetical protein
VGVEGVLGKGNVVVGCCYAFEEVEVVEVCVVGVLLGSFEGVTPVTVCFSGFGYCWAEAEVVDYMGWVMFWSAFRLIEVFRLG